MFTPARAKFAPKYGICGILIKMEHGFRYIKAYGQNFLTDINLLRAIVTDAGVGAADTVVEVGAGAGALTEPLAEAAGKVVAYEIDKRLEAALRVRLAGRNNVELVFKDILREPFDALLPKIRDGYKLVANLPYYITTPVLFYFLESALPPETAAVTVQREVADRLSACPGTKDYGALTVSVQSLYTVRVSRRISRKLFTPVPNVDSAVVVLQKKPEPPENPVMLRKLIRAAFAMRRKTLVNNLTAGLSLSRADAERALAAVGLPPAVRGEALTVEQFAALAEYHQRTMTSVDGIR